MAFSMANDDIALQQRPRIRTCFWRQQGTNMTKRIQKLTTSKQVEEAFVRLFDQIDDGVNAYIGAAENRPLKEQAMRNAVGMLEILRTMYEKDLQLRLYESLAGTIQ